MNSIPYKGLDWQVQEDIDVCLAKKARLHPKQVMEFFQENPNTEIEIIWVDPASPSMISPKGRVVDPDKMEEYVETWKTTPEVFPPIVIDSDRLEQLCEGGHRTVAARKAKIPRILAIDVAPLYRKLRKELKPLLPMAKEVRRRQTEGEEEPWWAKRFSTGT